jgi:hypothetical protein
MKQKMLSNFRTDWTTKQTFLSSVCFPYLFCVPWINIIHSQTFIKHLLGAVLCLGLRDNQEVKVTDRKGAGFAHIWEENSK